MKNFLIIFLFLFISFQAFSYEKEDVPALEKQLFGLIENKNINDTVENIVNYLTFYYRNRDPRQAIEFFLKLQKVMLENVGKQYIKSSLAGLAGVYFDQGIYDKALEYNYQIFLIDPDTTDLFKNAWFYVDIGNIYFYNNMFEDALKNYQLAVDIFLKYLNNTTPDNNKYQVYNYGMGVCYNNIGLVYEELNDNYRALENHQIALKYRLSSDKRQGLGYSYGYLSKLYFKLGNDSLFNFYKQKVFDIFKNLDNKSLEYYLGLAEHYHIFGTIAMKQKKFAEAKEYFNNAIEIFKKTENNKYLIRTYYTVADLELEKKNFKEAEKFLLKGLGIADSLHFYLLKKEGMLKLIDFYKKTNRTDKAFAYLQNLNNFNDSINQAYMKLSLKGVENEIEIQKQIQKISLLEKDNAINKLNLDKRTNFIAFLIVVLILVAIITIILSLQYINKKKTASMFELKNKEIEDMNKLLDEKSKHFEELNSTKDKFFSIIAHDLKNPLSAFYRLTETLYESYNEFSEEERLSLLNDMRNSSKNVFDLLQNLLTWSRSQRNKIQINPVEVDMRFVVENIYQIFKQIADSKKIDLIIYCDRDVKLNIDVNILQTIIRNLVSNALKFTPEGGRVEIRAEKDNSNIIVYVQDTGVGIPNDKLPELFKVDKTYTTPGTNNETGTGLGLIICKEFIDKVGGKVDVLSEPEKGTTFRIILPIDKSSKS